MMIPARNQHGSGPGTGMRYRLQSADGRYASYRLGSHTVSLADETTAYVFRSLGDAEAAAITFGRQLGIALSIITYPRAPGRIRVGDRVKFSNPQAQEESAERFEVLELRGERALVRSIGSPMRITPTFVHLVDELETDE